MAPKSPNSLHKEYCRISNRFLTPFLPHEKDPSIQKDSSLQDLELFSNSHNTHRQLFECEWIAQIHCYE